MPSVKPLSLEWYLCLFISPLHNIYSFRYLLFILAPLAGSQILRTGREALEVKFKSSYRTWIPSATRWSYRLGFKGSSDVESLHPQEYSDLFFGNHNLGEMLLYILCLSSYCLFYDLPSAVIFWSLNEIMGVKEGHSICHWEYLIHVVTCSPALDSVDGLLSIYSNYF